MTNFGKTVSIGWKLTGGGRLCLWHHCTSDFRFQSSSGHRQDQQQFAETCPYKSILTLLLQQWNHCPRSQSWQGHTGSHEAAVSSPSHLSWALLGKTEKVSGVNCAKISLAECLPPWPFPLKPAAVTSVQNLLLRVKSDLRALMLPTTTNCKAHSTVVLVAMQGQSWYSFPSWRALSCICTRSPLWGGLGGAAK